MFEKFENSINAKTKQNKNSTATLLRDERSACHRCCYDYRVIVWSKTRTKKEEIIEKRSLYDTVEASLLFYN